MKTKQKRTFVCDFETTVYAGQVATEVWASACVEIGTEDVKIFHSIGEQYEYFLSLKTNIVAYYHNLKFDGAFWISYLLTDLKMKQAFDETDENGNGEFQAEKYMQNNTFKYSISDKGMWYTILIKKNNKIIELRDSLKLLPFSVKRIGQSFKTKHQKLEMEYEGFRYPGCEITEQEREYIANDVLVVKEALEFMFSEGHTKLTINACCLSEYKTIVGKLVYEDMFPDVYKVNIHQPPDKKGDYYHTAGDWIRKSYKGGWCYLVKGKENKIFKNGITADVNSLYPSMMSKESGNRYPIGYPEFWTGNYIPEEATIKNRYYFIRVKTRFYLKENKLPFIQIKGDLHYKGTEALESSDVWSSENKLYLAYYTDFDGNICDTRVELTLTMTDYLLFREHYHVIDFEIIDGCYFDTALGIFDTYIDKYKNIKLNSKGAMRELAKLFLNNLYGKMASSTDSSFKVAYEKDDGSIGFYPVEANEKKPGYIPVGSAITSYARNFTIRTAQKNYYGKDKPGFIYADTDSIHCDLKPEKLRGLTVHDKNFCCWKLEASWDKAIFARQKTYMEHVIAENLEPIEEPYWNIKCAGMPERCKNLFLWSMTGDVPKDEKLTEEEKEFLKTKRTVKDFTIGLKVPSKLLPKRIKGGVLLVPTTYEMR